jgi:hypothetical protein
MNTKANQKNSPGRAFTNLNLIPLLLAMSLGAQAADQYFAGDGTALNTAKWSPTAGGPYIDSFINNNVANFAVVNGTGIGATITVGGISATENFTISTAGGTIGGVAGATNPITVSAGKLFDAGSQGWSSGATVGFSMNGAGVFASAGGTYGGGFILNSGTVISRGPTPLAPTLRPAR